CMQGREYPLTL
nr:immunoglobulin light chain junction region [Macaca mulatta]